MLSIRTAVFGAPCRMRRVATSPDVPGIAQSITTTCGVSLSASLTVSSPSLDSPTTSISASSSSRRRNPRRTRVWSSTRRTVILFAMYVPVPGRYLHANERASHRRRQELDCAAEHLGALAHRDDAEAPPGCVRTGAFAVILDVELDHAILRAQSHPCLPGPRVPRHVVECLLHHAIDMDGRGAVNRHRRSVALV